MAPAVELVVLVDSSGAAVGTADKATVHSVATPLHLGFSCYVLDRRGRVLVSRRALGKRTFGGVWTNSFCGHPGPGEPLVQAARRRARVELGLVLGEVRLVLPDFSYRARMDGVEENELCPVLAAFVGDRPGSPDGAGDIPTVDPDPAEIDRWRWEPWVQFRDAVLSGRYAVSSWCLEQVRLLATYSDDPTTWPGADSARLPLALRPPTDS